MPLGGSDVEGFEQFYAATAPSIRAYLLRHCGDRSSIDDLFQTTYSKFLASRMAKTPQAVEAKAYLYRIASNVMADHGRALQRAARFEASAQQPVAQVRPTSALESIELREALSSLSRREQQLLWLVYAEGFSHREVARIMKLSQASVRVLTFRARKKLKRILVPGEDTSS
ncbi:MAG: sigma-70 family RNA polymerase sigma factor [Acidobacteriia bacterium]|nr:sigma-70 family RNA polymerase sigma factor [Terriglobia bacterium]MYG01291.1 sigma-70 family RNA polymerase sigma factor [Terriglobia bacterium]MYK09236.1 sigma-70 family RNA polymerase sigma factor [Terriglobia bacterium]